jgi:G3E family GTPase
VPLPEGGHPEHEGVRAHSIVFDGQLDWTAFGVWLTMLLAARGSVVLRVTGLLDVGARGPLLLNGVQHVVHPPVHLDR